MKALEDFYAELSNLDRLKILQLLTEKNLNLTKLSVDLCLSRQEASRHLTRLRKARLARKGVDGKYKLTNLGKILFQLTKGHHFVMNNKDYFVKHDLSEIPLELLLRISEIEDSERVKGVMKVIGCIESIIQRADEQIEIMYDQIPLNSVPIIKEKIKTGLKIVCLVLENDEKSILTLEKNGLFRERKLQKVRTFLLLTDKEAIIAFADLSGKVDYNDIFYVDTDDSIKWISDLFSYFWQKAFI